VLGPDLYSFYVADLHRQLGEELNLAQFADDTKISISYDLPNAAKASEVLQKGINKLETYFGKLQLQVSEAKTKIMYIGLHNPKHSYLSLSGEILQSEDVIRDLGVFMHKELRFSSHIDIIVNRAKTQMFRILKVFCISNSALLCLLFKVYVRPILEYASVVWNPHLKKDIEKIERVQHTFTRIVFFRCFGNTPQNVPN
jgi:hypothetical protein